MGTARRIGWILIGVLVGAIATTSFGAAREPQSGRVTRLIVMGTSSPLQTHNFSFIKDTKSGACWLAALSGPEGGMSIATAPAEACEQ
jgi:hypothetical protein